MQCLIRTDAVESYQRHNLEHLNNILRMVLYLGSDAALSIGVDTEGIIGEVPHRFRIGSTEALMKRKQTDISTRSCHILG